METYIGHAYWIYAHPHPIVNGYKGMAGNAPAQRSGLVIIFRVYCQYPLRPGSKKPVKAALSIFVVIAGIILVHYAVTSATGDVIGGWSLNAEQLRIGFTRMAFPFFAGLLLSRVTRPSSFKYAFPGCTILLIVCLAMPRIGGKDQLWMNGLYDSLTIIFIFPLIVYLGASGQVHGLKESKICKFLGDISYPIYITHYPLIYIYFGWKSNHPQVSLLQAVPYMIATFAAAVTIAYLSLKYYDEPVRAWLKKKVFK